MFVVVYSFDVKSGKEESFTKAWIRMTKLIKDHEGGLGSRLHKNKDGKYIAYAQWPSREIWKESGNQLPASAIDVRTQMRECCSSMDVSYEMEVLNDLLINPR